MELPVETDYVRSAARHASNTCYYCSHLKAIFNFSGGFGLGSVWESGDFCGCGW